MKQGMATTLVEDSPGKVAPPSKKKQKDKSSAGSSLKGSLPNSLLGSSGTSSNSSSGGVARMDVSELPSFTQNDCSLSSTSGSDGKLSNFISGLKNHSTTPEMNSSSTKSSSKRKSGSESSNGGGSSGGQGSSSLQNSTHPITEGGSIGRRGLAGTGRGFSSGSSDGEDEHPKHNVFRKTQGVKPLPPASSATTASSDDEATDSADEGNSGGEERGARRRGREGEIPSGRQSDRLMSRKDSSESTNSATSPAPNPGHTTSTIFVESTLPKEPLSGGNSLVNMAVGYGAAAESMAPTSTVFDKTPSHSPPGTPTMDSPKPVSDGVRSPGTPIPLSLPNTGTITEVMFVCMTTETPLPLRARATYLLKHCWVGGILLPVVASGECGLKAIYKGCYQSNSCGWGGGHFLKLFQLPADLQPTSFLIH